MRSIEWRYFRWYWVTRNYPIPPPFPSHACTVRKRPNRSSSFLIRRLPSAYLTMYRKGIRVSPKTRVLLCRNFPETLALENFATARRSSESGAVNLGGRSVWQTGDGRRSPVYYTVGVKHRIARVCQRQRRLFNLYYKTSLRLYPSSLLKFKTSDLT